jgi:hypothetical protein
MTGIEGFTDEARNGQFIAHFVRPKQAKPGGNSTLYDKKIVFKT